MVSFDCEKLNYKSFELAKQGLTTILTAKILTVSLDSDGRQSVRLLHLVRPIAQSQSVHATADRLIDLRRVLGVLLVLHLQLERDGSCGDQIGR